MLHPFDSAVSSDFTVSSGGEDRSISAISRQDIHLPSEVGLPTAVIGVGLVGSGLLLALDRTAHKLVGVGVRSQASARRAADLVPHVPALGVGELLDRAEVLWLTVGDDALPALVSDLVETGRVRSGQIFIHTAGALGLEVLAPLSERGALTFALHPAMTFTGTSVDLSRLSGCHWAVTCALSFSAIGQVLVLDLDGVPHLLPEGARGLYHAALAHGANHLVTLVTQSVRALRLAQISDPEQFIFPLLQAALDRALTEGEAGLTGPVARGDSQTVREHLRVLKSVREVSRDDLDPCLPPDDLSDLPESYAQMARATVMRAIETGRLTKERADGLLRVLDQNLG